MVKGVFVGEAQKMPMNQDERELPVREAARQLWLQAQRMNISENDVKRITQEEYNQLSNQ